MSLYQSALSSFPVPQRWQHNQSRTLLLAGTGFMLALLLPSVIAVFFDARLLNGISIWSKPIKFELSITLFFLTVFWLLPLLPAAEQQSRMIRWPVLAMVIAGVFEIVYIVMQAARGRASHFNSATAFETVMYSLMFWGAFTMVATAAWIGWRLWRNAASQGNSGLHLGAAIGLMLSSLLTLLTATVLGSGQIAGPGHWVGGLRTDLGGLPLLGWSRSGGDLRVPHFFASHIMQALPVLGLLADRFAPRRSVSLVWFGAIVSIVVVFLTFVQAVSGYPFLPL
jgi:hypothetical protein